MITVVFEAIKNCIVAMWDWLTVAETFQGIADSIEIGYECPYCGAQRGQLEYCQGCGAQ